MRRPHRYSACCGLASVIFFDVLEARARDAQVRELDERLPREQERVGLRRLASAC